MDSFPKKGISRAAAKIRIELLLYRIIFKYRLPKREIEQGEKSRDKKAISVQKWSKNHPERSEKLNQQIDDIFRRLSMEDYEVRLDMLFCYAAYGFSPNEYLVYGIHGKCMAERKTFLSDRESIVIGYRLNDRYAMRTLNDKFLAYQKFEKFYKRKALCIEGEKDRAAFLEFAASTPVFIKKDAKEACGRSVERVDLSQRNMTADAYFDSLLTGRRVILEELIQQAAVMEQFNSSSVNTVRCTTFSTGGNVEVFFCFFRTGRKGAVVDNGGAGGLLIGVDEKTGVLNTDAVDELNHRFSEHPDTHVTFKGFQLPDWEAMVATCKEMALLLPEVRMIGWDMAYTDQGWVVVEGNALTEMIGPQSTSEKGIRSKFEAMTDWK